MTKKQTYADIIVPDTSVIAEGLVSQYIKEKKIQPKKLVIPEAVLNEIEHQANQGRETGYIGLDELKKLQEMTSKTFTIEFDGERPGEFEIKFARSGAVDNLIRDIARKHKATLMTADRVQALVAKGMGIPVEFITFSFDETKIEDPLKKFFDDKTMSVHLKENSQTISKRGKPGDWEFKRAKHTPDNKEMERIAKGIVEAAQKRRDGYIEIERKGSTIVQLGRYRIVIAKPPFASVWEITAVRPVAHLSLDDYKLEEKFIKRLEEKADGILIAGSPGEGKSTFTQALGEFYAKKDKIVKTVEAPRDLVLPDTITQYSASHASPEEIRDVLLLNRPDYTIYDEIRNTQDFELFADMRLAGVGMIGVVHAAEAVDAIQRFIGRIELGMIPQVVDTVVFIKAGAPKKVYTIAIQVKTPAGMTEADLARPVVIIKDFFTGNAEFEIYTYGDQTTVVPVTASEQNKKPAVWKLAEDTIKDYFGKFSGRSEVEMLSDGRARVYVPESQIAKIIGKGGATIGLIEQDLGIKLDIQELSGNKNQKGLDENTGKSIKWEAHIAKRNITVELPFEFSNKEVDLYDGHHYVQTVQASKKGQIKISTGSDVGRRLKKALDKDVFDIRA